MLKIWMVDDEAAQRELLAQMIARWMVKTGNAPQITAFNSAESLLFSYAEDKSVDILLLDIQMKKMDGVELAKKIRKDNETVQIIFITGYNEYISEGYEVSALHYLMKPVREEKLHTVLDRAVQKLKHNEKNLTLETADGTVRIPLREIRFIEVHHNYITIHGKTDITMKMALSEIEKELDERFFRTGRSFIVNLSYIHKTTKTDVILTDGTEVPLSRGFYEAVNKAFIHQK